MLKNNKLQSAIIMDASCQNILKPSIQDRKKAYQTWKGFSKFLFDGAIYIGPEYYYGLLTNSYIHIYSWLFFAFVLIVTINLLYRESLIASYS